LSFCKSKR